MKKHFVRFYSPGTFVAEDTVKPIKSWDVDAARQMAESIKERHGATPYAFRFETRERGAEDLDSKVTKVSNLYYFGVKVETLEEVEARNDPQERILRDNMRGNGWKKIVTTTSGWKWTQPLKKGDVVLGACAKSL